MKKLISAILLGLLASSFASLAQNATAAAPDSAAVVTTNAPPPAVITNAPPLTAEPPTVVNTPGGAPAQGAIIPIIVIDEAKLTEAIRNLARLARLNYLLDPKIGFGQPDPAHPGQMMPEPIVSIRWENVTAEQALNALLNNYNLQMVDDPKSHIVRITVKDPAAPPPLTTKIIQLKYASPTNVVVAIQNTLTDKRSKVVPDVRTSQLVVLATEQEMLDVDLLVERLDTITKQVLIEAKLLETSMNPNTIKGIDWSGTLQNQHLAFGNNLQDQPVPAESVNRPLSTL